MDIHELAKRLDEFCIDYRIPKRFHGRLRLLSDMAFVFNIEIEMHLKHRKEQEKSAHD